MSNPINTTTTRATGRAFASAIVGALLAWGATKWGNLNTGTFTVLVPVATGVYYSAVTQLEKKYPNLGWLLGTLPQPKVVATPVVEPTPAPVAAKAPAAKKAATKE